MNNAIKIAHARTRTLGIAIWPGSVILLSLTALAIVLFGLTERAIALQVVVGLIALLIGAEAFVRLNMAVTLKVQAAGHWHNSQVQQYMLALISAPRCALIGQLRERYDAVEEFLFTVTDLDRAEETFRRAVEAEITATTENRFSVRQELLAAQAILETSRDAAMAYRSGVIDWE